jgi:lipopolysaccharide biosynthesis glycosyltransferase
VESPIRVYVATTEAQMLSVKVLEYSIKKHASMTVHVYPMHEYEIKHAIPKDIKNKPRTPFSFQRFWIPELCAYEGHAIYLDSDMQVFSDIRKLWQIPMHGNQVQAVREPGEHGRRPQFSVMKIDCSKLDWDIRKIVNDLDHHELTYEELMYEMSIAPDIGVDIPQEWNSLERYDEGKTSLIHYTDMDTQPWISTANKWGYLWVRDLIEAIHGGYIDINYVKEHVEKGFIRPSLLYQIEKNIVDPYLLPRKILAKESGYSPPYMSLQCHDASPWLSNKYRVKAILYRKLQNIPAGKLKRKILSVSGRLFH